MTALNDAIEQAVNGEYPESSSKLDGHEFYIRAVGNRNMLKEDETGYFRHDHVGKDDRVFYSVKLGKNKGDYSVRLTRIQFRGPFTKNGFRDIGDRGIDVTDAVKVIAAAGSLSALPSTWIPFVVAVTDLDAQGFLDGNWVPAAAKVADKIGARLAQDIK